MVGRWKCVLVGAAVMLGGGLAVVPVGMAQAAGEAAIVYARSGDGGATFSAPVPVSTGGGEVGTPRVAAAGAVHMLWSVEAESADDESDVFYRRSDDGGVSFGAAQNLSPNPGESGPSDVAVDGGGLQVVWEHGSPDAAASEVVTVRSPDGGESFSEPANVTGTADQDDSDPDLAVEGPLVAVGYVLEVDPVNEDVMVQRSGDGGQTWGGPVNVSHDGSPSADPAVAVSGGIVHVVFANEGSEPETDDRLAYARSTDGGATFAEPVVLPEGAEGQPALAVHGGVVNLFGCSGSDPATSELWLYRSEDGGATFAAPVAVTGTPGECDTPTVAGHGDLVVVAWEEAASGAGSDVLVVSSSDGGRTFTGPVNVSQSPGDSEEPSIAVDAATGGVHLVWTEEAPEPAEAAPQPAAHQAWLSGKTSVNDR